MSAARRSPLPADWRQLAILGEQLLATTSLAAQRDTITAVTEQLIDGQVQLWIDENQFRLPDWDEKPLFSRQPPSTGMRRVFKTGVKCIKSVPDDSPEEAYVAVPLEEQGAILGVLQVNRAHGPVFQQEEIDWLEGIASIAAIGLVASHRVAVERFRVEQLNLVHKVGAQIAVVLDVDKLAHYVTDIIRQTFKYYYVAIFTLDPGSQALRLRSSAMAARRGRRKASIAMEVELGQGCIGCAAQSGEEILCGNVRTEPRFRYMDGLPETRSEVVLPLKVEDRVLGVLDVQGNQLNAFHSNDLLVLRALANNIAVAIEGARLYGGLQRRADQLALMAEVSSSVTATLDLKQLMHDVAVLVHDRFGYPFVHLFTVHSRRRQIHYEAGSGERSHTLEGHILDLDDPHGIIPWVARNGQSALVNDVAQDPRYRPSSILPADTKSELAVPLIFNNQVLGVLDIHSSQPNTFTDDDRILFEALAHNIAAAINNADLYRSELWRRQVADSLREVAGLLSETVGVEQVLDVILTELERNLPSDVAAIWLLDEGELYLAAVHGCDAQELENARRASEEASLHLTSALVAESPIIRKLTDPLGPSGLAAGFESNYSSIAAPLRIADQPVGLLTLTHHAPGRYGHEAQAMTATFASYAAVAIENARLYDDAQEQAYASAALLQVAQAVVSLNSLDEILGTIVRIMPILVGVERCAIFLWNEAHQAHSATQAYGLSEEAEAVFWRDEFALGEFPLLDASREVNRALVCKLDAQADPESWVEKRPPWDDETSPILRSDDRVLLAYPLAIKNDIFGVMLVEEAAGGRRFRNRRMEIITGVAQQAAMAIQSDRLQHEMVVRERLEHELQLARQIQQTFIPESLPTHPGWELAARWRTARQVGGDFYDVFELPGQRLGLIIADVADKGIPAALFMALTRTLVRAAVIERQSPAEVLARVNHLLIPDTRQSMFVTAVYAVLDYQTGAMTYANAGHSPPLWVRRCTHQIEHLARTSIALGVMDDIEVKQRTIPLEPGDTILLYTDGLTEAFSPGGDLFGEHRLWEVLASLSVESAEKMLDVVEVALYDFMGPLPPEDDLTMLAIRRLEG